MSAVAAIPTFPDLAGKVAVVTGSSRGIGAETARYLAANRVKVVVNGRDDAAMEFLARGELNVKVPHHQKLPVRHEAPRSGSIVLMCSSAGRAASQASLAYSRTREARYDFRDATDRRTTRYRGCNIVPLLRSVLLDHGHHARCCRRK